MQSGLVIVNDLGSQSCQTGNPRQSRALATVGVREKQHVRNNARHALQIFEIGGQNVAQLLCAAWLAQGQFTAADQRGQRCVEFMGYIGVEGFHLPVGHGQAFQQGVELVDQWAQFLRLIGVVKPFLPVAAQVLGTQQTRLLNQ